MDNVEFKLYQLLEFPHKIVPAYRHRDWQKDNPYTFKCRPMSNANCFGWDILCRNDFEVEWNGDTSVNDVVVDCKYKSVYSNFGHGSITFKIGYTFHTSKNWSMMISPLPNYDHKIFTPYSALVETDELKYPIVITTKLNTPGKFIVKENTPICRIFPILLGPVLECQPKIDVEPDDFLEYRTWQARERNKFLNTEEYKTVKNGRPYRSEKLGWQKFYDKVAKFSVFKMKEVI